jgi:RNA polymerase II elongation factor ELL
MKDGNKARFLSQSNKKPLPGNAARSMPTSPALTGISSPALGPTSVPLSQQQAERTKAIRRPIIHKLALGPATEDVISKYKKDDATDQEFRLALDKVAELKDGKWKLKQKAFRDLDVFTYKRYTLDERQVAIDNAVHVYDKMRLGTSEPEWERLLPMEERGAGKCLSKLQAKIAVGAIKPAKAPKIKVHGAEDSGRDTPAAADNDLDDLFGDKIPTTTLKSETMVRSHSNPPVAKQKRISEKEQQAKRLLAKGKPIKSTSAKSSDKKSAGKESSKIKSSEFVRESDEEDDYLLPAAKAAPASTTASKINGAPAPAPKTKQAVKISSRDEFEEVAPKLNGTQKPKINNTSPPKSSPLASSPPTNASDFDDSSSSSSNSLKRKATDSSSDIPISKRHQKSSSSSTSSSIASSNSIVNGDRHDPYYYEVMRKDVSATKKFVLYYNRYLDLYRELSASQERDRDVEKMADLMAMHERLAQMKADILPASET